MKSTSSYFAVHPRQRYSIESRSDTFGILETLHHTSSTTPVSMLSHVSARTRSLSSSCSFTAKSLLE